MRWKRNIETATERDYSRAVPAFIISPSARAFKPDNLLTRHRKSFPRKLTYSFI